MAGIAVALMECAACSNTPTQAPMAGGQEVTQVTFDPSAWADDKRVFDPPYVRAAMIDDVVRTVAGVGAARADVERLLGKARDTNKFAGHDLVYFVGPEAGLGIDSRWLVIDFDDAGKVVSASLTSD